MTDISFKYFLSPTPAPTVGAVGALIGGEILNPITNSFSQLPLPKTFKVTPAKLFGLAIDTGYVLRKNSPAFFALSTLERKNLLASLIARTRWLLTLVKVDSNGDLQPADCVRLLEKSDLSTLSFYLGQIAARISAEAWVRPTYALEFVHRSVYEATGLMSVVSSQTGKTKDLDYLFREPAQSRSWSVLEAKSDSKRERGIVKGVAQVTDALLVTQNGTVCVPPLYSLVSYHRPKRPAVAKASHALSSPPVIELIQVTSNGAGQLPTTAGNASIAVASAVAVLSAAGCQFSLLRQLPSASRRFQTIAGRELFNRFSVRNPGWDNVLVFLPEPTLFKAFQFELTIFHLVEMFYGRGPQPRPSTDEVKQIVETAALSSGATTVKRRRSAETFLLSSFWTETDSPTLERLALGLDLDKRYDAFQSAKQEFAGKAFAELRLGSRTPQFVQTICGAVFFDPPLPQDLIEVPDRPRHRA